MKKAKKLHSPANKRKTGESRRLANLEKGAKYRFVPGQSGNPSGRPPAIFSKECRAKLSELVPGDPLQRTYARYFADLLAHRGMKGDERAISELIDRAEGRPRQSLDVNDAHPDPLSELIAAMDRESEKIGPPPNDEQVQ